MYACRYPVVEGAIAIVGRQFPYDWYSVETGTSTGVMGQVTEVSPKLTINKEKALEIDYVFIEGPKKKDLKQCENFLKCGKWSLQQNTSGCCSGSPHYISHSEHSHCCFCAGAW